MKSRTRLFVSVAGLMAIAAGFTACHAFSEKEANEKSEAPAVMGSIRPTGKPTPAEQVALAKISMEDARQKALSATPGTVITAELEVEDGNLQYSFEVVGADKSVTEVEVDAGDGKILGTEKEGAGKEDKD